MRWIKRVSYANVVTFPSDFGSQYSATHDVKGTLVHLSVGALCWPAAVVYIRYIVLQRPSVKLGLGNHARYFTILQAFIWCIRLTVSI